MRRPRRGTILVMVTLVLPVLIAFVALVVDVGHARVVYAQLQAATDAAALGAAKQLDGTEEGVERARAAARDLALINLANGRPVELRQGSIEIGTWEDRAFRSADRPSDANAVRIRARRGSLFSAFFLGSYGQDPLAARVAVVAVQGGESGAGAVPWYLPFALPDCLVEQRDPTELADMRFVLNPAGVDNTGWALIDSRPQADALRAHFDDVLPCMHEWADTGHVEGTCVGAAVGDTVQLGNGVITNALRTWVQGIDRGIPWDASRWGPLPPQNAQSDVRAYGKALVGAVPVFHAGAEYCAGGGGAWNQDAPLVGFVWGVLYDGRHTGPARDKNVWVRLDLSHTYPVGSSGGGPGWGVTAPRFGRIVR